MASIGGKYDAFFGRDSLLIAKILLDTHPNIAKNVLIKLSQKQGQKNNALTEESPGKILHETRGMFTSYIAADSTPLFLALYCDYFQKYGRIDSSVEAAAKNAAEWILENINSDNLIEIKKRNIFENPYGQVWKDSYTAFIFPDGKLADTKRGIIYLEIQTLCMDALRKYGKIIEKSEQEYANKILEISSKIRESVLQNFWIQGKNIFAGCLIRDKNKKLIPVTTSESSMGRILDTTLFDNLSSADKRLYVDGIIQEIVSPNFLTNAGIRCRSLEYANKLKFADFHGSYVSWPIDSYLIAQGLRRQHHEDLAADIERRVYHAIKYLGHNYEFVYVGEKGDVLLPTTTRTDKSLAIQFLPEKQQGWTVALASVLKKRFENVSPAHPVTTQRVRFSKAIGLYNTFIYLLANI